MIESRDEQHMMLKFSRRGQLAIYCWNISPVMFTHSREMDWRHPKPAKSGGGLKLQSLKLKLVNLSHLNRLVSKRNNSTSSIDSSFELLNFMEKSEWTSSTPLFTTYDTQFSISGKNFFDWEK